MAPTTPPVINPLIQILWMDLGDGGAAGAVAVATSARKKQGKKAPRGLETLKVSNNFGPAVHHNPPRAAKVDGGVREPEFAGGTPSPHKKARGEEASFLFRPNCEKATAAAKGGHNVEAKTIAKDDSDDNEGTSAIICPNHKKAFTAAKGGRDDNSDNDKGASVVVCPDREKAFAAAKGGRDDDFDDDKGASNVVRPDCKKAFAAAKGGRDDDSDNDKSTSVVVRPDREKAFATAKGGHKVKAKAGAKDDSDNNDGASGGRPRCKTRAIKGGCGAAFGTHRPKAGQDPDNPADRAGNGLPETGPAKVPPKSGRGVPAPAAFSGRGAPVEIVNKDGSSGDVSLASKDKFARGEGGNERGLDATIRPQSQAQQRSKGRGRKAPGRRNCAEGAGGPPRQHQ
jgi:hypothetical protein